MVFMGGVQSGNAYFDVKLISWPDLKMRKFKIIFFMIHSAGTTAQFLIKVLPPA